MNAQTKSVYTISTSPELNLASHFNCNNEDRQEDSHGHGKQSWKSQVQIPWTIWERSVRVYCILNTEINIILLHRYKQHRESGIIQWGCCLLDESFHLVLMITFFVMQICHRAQHWVLWSTRWREFNQHLPSKQTSARGGNAYSYNGFLNFVSTRSFAFWRLTSSPSSMS
jgi:hypothetical protein